MSISIRGFQVKKLTFLLLFLFFILATPAYARQRMVSGVIENDFLLDSMLPNPVVYLYGTDSNGYPLLLMNFSATIPFYGIQPLRRFYIFRKKVSSLRFLSLYLKLYPTENPSCRKNFYYKIVKIKCDEESQPITYKDSNEFKVHFEPTYKEVKPGYIEDTYKTQSDYISKLPIIAYSGVGSDTMKIMLRRGKKYPIPAGHVNVAMAVVAVPSYSPPVTYNTIRCNDYVQDFLDAKDSDNNPHTKIRTISFGKIYSDNKIKGYYEINPKNNPHKMILDSAVIPGSCHDQILDDDRYMDNDFLKAPSGCPPAKECCPSSVTINNNAPSSSSKK